MFLNLNSIDQIFWVRVELRECNDVKFFDKQYFI